MKAPFQLYKLQTAIADLVERIDDAENPLELEALVDSIAKLQDDSTARFQDLRNAMLNESAKQKAIEEEIDRLTTMKKSAEKIVDTLKGATLSLMSLAGLSKVQFPTGGFLRVQANSQPSIQVSVPIEQLPKEWFETRTKAEYILDRKAVLDAKALGTEVPKEITVTTGQHVRLG